ncbi:hypothetical protein BKA80DRAFT_303245 [Phyllosticta citrichinensis]
MIQDTTRPGQPQQQNPGALDGPPAAAPVGAQPSPADAKKPPGKLPTPEDLKARRQLEQGQAHPKVPKQSEQGKAHPNFLNSTVPQAPSGTSSPGQPQKQNPGAPAAAPAASQPRMTTTQERLMLLREQEREAGQSSPKPTPPTTTAPVPQAPAIKRPSGSSSQSAQAQAQTPKRPPPGESAFPYLTPSIGKPPIEEFETAPPPTAQAYKPQAKPSASLEQGKPNDVPVEAQGQVKPNATVEAQGEGKAKCVPLDYHSAEQGRGNARYQGNQQDVSEESKNAFDLLPRDPDSDGAAEEQTAAKDGAAEEQTAAKDSAAEEQIALKDGAAKQHTAAEDGAAEEQTAAKDDAAAKPTSGGSSSLLSYPMSVSTKRLKWALDGVDAADQTSENATGILKEEDKDEEDGAIAVDEKVEG